MSAYATAATGVDATVTLLATVQGSLAQASLTTLQQGVALRARAHLQRQLRELRQPREVETRDTLGAEPLVEPWRQWFLVLGVHVLESVWRALLESHEEALQVAEQHMLLDRVSAR